MEEHEPLQSPPFSSDCSVSDCQVAQEAAAKPVTLQVPVAVGPAVGPTLSDGGSSRRSQRSARFDVPWEGPSQESPSPGGARARRRSYSPSQCDSGADFPASAAGALGEELHALLAEAFRRQHSSIRRLLDRQSNLLMDHFEDVVGQGFEYMDTAVASVAIANGGVGQRWRSEASADTRSPAGSKPTSVDGDPESKEPSSDSKGDDAVGAGQDSKDGGSESKELGDGKGKDAVNRSVNMDLCPDGAAPEAPPASSCAVLPHRQAREPALVICRGPSKVDVDVQTSAELQEIVPRPFKPVFRGSGRDSVRSDIASTMSVQSEYSTKSLAVSSLPSELDGNTDASSEGTWDSGMHTKNFRGNTLQDLDGDVPNKRELRKLLMAPPGADDPWWVTYLDVTVGFMVFASTVSLFVQSMWNGNRARQVLQMHGDGDGGWPGAETTFMVMDYVFSGLFLLELLVRVSFYRRKYFEKLANVFDSAIVLIDVGVNYILMPLTGSSSGALDVTIARLARSLRLIRIFRVVRIYRFATHFGELRLLTKTIAACASALGWSTALLAMIILGGGVFLNQCLLDFVMDDAQDPELRQWLFRYYGNGVRATYTLFEATFSGCWPSYARPMIDDVHWAFGFFWIVYNITVTFAVLRIIGAIFVNESIKAAQGDAEMITIEKMKENEKFKRKIRRFFEVGDTSGDGAISKTEFKEMLADPGIRTWMQVLELEIYEVQQLFDLLDEDGSGEISMDEFLGGAQRLRGHARAIDSMAIMAEQGHIKQKLKDVEKLVKSYCKEVHKQQKVFKRTSAKMNI